MSKISFTLPDLSKVKHHPVMEELVGLLCTKTQNNDRGFFQAEVAYFLGKMASMMRATVETKDRGDIPVNIYALALANSGYGKGHSISIMETELLVGFKARFMDDTFPVLAEQNLWVIANQRAAKGGGDQQAEYDKLAKEFEAQGEYIFAFDAGSSPAVKQMRNKLILASVGSINLQIDEIGLNLSKEIEALSVFLELYDQGMTKSKLTKVGSDNKRTKELDGKTPANAMLFGSPSKLLDGGATEELFYSLLETGYARRSIFGYGQQQKASKDLTPEEIYEKLTEPQNSDQVTKYRRLFYTLADPALYGWKMTVDKPVSVALLTYRVNCEKLAEHLSDHEEIKKSELSHRYFKALKLAGAYAFVDGSTEILMDHLLSAIKLVEESGESFQTILSREKPYVKLAKFIAGTNTEVTHAEMHEQLPFYKASQNVRNELMGLATAWGYKNNIIIKKSFVDGIEFFKGEKLQETDLSKMVVSHSSNFAYEYVPEEAPFDKLHMMTQAADMHWTTHHFKDGHRSDENVIPGFNLIVIDVDGNIELTRACELMEDYKFLAYTTKRHTDAENRFRMIFPTNYRLEMDKIEYKEFMNGILEWLPFEVDEASTQISKKWATYDGGSFLYNLEGKMIDVLPFIPKTKRNEEHRLNNKSLSSLDSLERWFAGNMATGNRNNQMIKYAFMLLDAGWDYSQIKQQILTFDSKLPDPMGEDEISRSILITIARKLQKVA